MEPGITGLADVRGESKRKGGRESERPRFSGQTNVIARESCPRPSVHARASTRAAYTVIVLLSRFALSRLTGRHYGDYDSIDASA